MKEQEEKQYGVAPSQISKCLAHELTLGKKLAEAIRLVADEFKVRRTDVELVAEITFPDMLNRISAWGPNYRRRKHARKNNTRRS